MSGEGGRSDGVNARERVWLASYPKSGNTWLRMLIGALSLTDGEALDINRSAEKGGSASARAVFDYWTLIESALLPFDEVDRLRPRIYAQLGEVAWGDDGGDGGGDEGDGDTTHGQVRFAKVHDAYAQTSAGEPLLGGLSGAKGAILIVRDPRDVAPSLANHNRSTVDEAIDIMGDAKRAFSGRSDRQSMQLRQRLAGWSGHAASWLEQEDIPVHLIRYEDLKRDTAGELSAAMDFAGRPIRPDEAERAASLTAFSALQAQERATGFVEAPALVTSFFRRGEVGGWRDELSPAQVRRIEADHGAMMEHLGYPMAADLTERPRLAVSGGARS